MKAPRVVIQVEPAERGVYIDALVDGWGSASHAAAYAIAADASRVIAEIDEAAGSVLNRGLYSALPIVERRDLQPGSERPPGFGRWHLRVRAHATAVHSELRAAFDRGATFECSRCGELVHGPGGHLNVGDYGERWMCPALQEQT